MVSIVEKFDIPKEVVVKIENSTVNLSKKDIKVSIKISKPFKVYISITQDDRSMPKND